VIQVSLFYCFYGGILDCNGETLYCLVVSHVFPAGGLEVTVASNCISEHCV
jgi:hypothetical protein